MTEIHFDNRADASRAAAAQLHDCLAAELRASPRATLVVSGGSTPALCLTDLSGMDLPWERVDVTLTDERVVPGDHPASNSRMVRQHLLAGRAGSAVFVPVESEALARLTAPFAGVLVGMGEDGHFASLFPDSANLAEGLDLDNPAACLPVRTAASDLARVSLTLARLVRSRLIVLLAFGDAKRRILENPAGYPVESLLTQSRAPVCVIWAP